MATGTVKNLLNAIYPVGAIYLSVNATSPATLFGGTWEQIKDTFLLTAGDTYAAGATGGSATSAHTHTLNNAGFAKLTAFSTDSNRVHYREVSGVSTWTATYRFSSSGTGDSSKTSTYGVELGGRTAGASDTNNMPPYLAVYAWKRTA